MVPTADALLLGPPTGGDPFFFIILHVTCYFMAKDRVRPYTYSAGLKDLQVMLKRVSPDDTDFTLHGVRVMGWNRAAADNAALAEAVPQHRQRHSHTH